MRNRKYLHPIQLASDIPLVGRGTRFLHCAVKLQHSRVLTGFQEPSHLVLPLLLWTLLLTWVS